MESFDFPVGLGPIRPGLLHSRAGVVAGAVPQPGAVAGAVVGDDTLTVDADRPVPGRSPCPEAGCGGGLFVVEDLGVGDAGPVVDSGVDVAVTDTGMAPVRVVASSMETPATAIGDPGNLLDIDVDQLARRVPLIPGKGLSDALCKWCGLT